MQGRAFQAEGRTNAKVPGRKRACRGGRALDGHREYSFERDCGGKEDELRDAGRRQVGSGFCKLPGSLGFVCATSERVKQGTVVA